MAHGSARRARWMTTAFASVVAVLFVGAAVTTACSEPYQEDAPLPEASTPDVVDGGVDTASPDPCDHARGLGPPPVDDAPSVELPAFFLAVKELRFQPSQDAPALGFDLDGVCTCETKPGTAFDGGPSCVSKDPHCDLARGVDNATSDLVQRVSPVYPIASSPNTLIASGRRTLLVQISRYNGKPNDKEVLIAIALSDGIRTSGCRDSVEDPVKGIWSPAWCGDDPWTFRSDAVIPNTKQPVLQTTGYVREGKLAFELPTLSIPFAEDSTLQMGSAVFVGKLVPLGEDLKPRDPAREPTPKEKRLWSLEDAVAGGRVRAVDLLAGLGAIEQPKTGDAATTWVCQSNLFEVLRVQVCSSADIARASTFDFVPSTACDALSTGIGFTAFPVLPGDVRALTPTQNPCIAGSDGQPDAATKLYSCD